MNKYQKAIEVIDTLLHLMCGEEREDGYKPTMEEMSNSMDLLKELVDKETPKKPEIKELIRKNNYRDERNSPRSDWWCPNCHLEHMSGNDLKYCPSCGQALDWRDGDER